jgi:hypothetical protein
VGIDHLILDKHVKIVQKRRDHSAAVLWKQYEQKQQQQQESEADVSTIILGRFAEQSSLKLKSTRNAIARAKSRLA